MLAYLVQQTRPHCVVGAATVPDEDEILAEIERFENALKELHALFGYVTQPVVV